MKPFSLSALLIECLFLIIRAKNLSNNIVCFAIAIFFWFLLNYVIIQKKLGSELRVFELSNFNKKCSFKFLTVNENVFFMQLVQAGIQVNWSAMLFQKAPPDSIDD